MTKAGAIAALGALAQDTRLDIFRLLVERGPEGMPAGEIGERLKQPSPTLSFHLNQLRYAGLVSSRRESRSIIYSANFSTMNGLMSYLTDKCCGGRPELCGPQVFPPAACAEGECAPGACAPIQIGAAKVGAAAPLSGTAPRKRAGAARKPSGARRRSE
jgi:DNA-binding transcriptional ArsR family regulator